MNKNSNVVTWWKSLPWYWRIPAFVVLIGAAFLFVVTIGGKLIPKGRAVSGNPYRDGLDARGKAAKAATERAKEDQARAEIAIEKSEKELQKIGDDHDKASESVDGCGGDIACIDSVLERERKRRRD